MKFLATSIRHGHAHSEEIDAESWEEAEAIAAGNGWTLEGEIVHTYEYGPNHPPPSLGVH